MNLQVGFRVLGFRVGARVSFEGWLRFCGLGFGVFAGLGLRVVLTHGMGLIPCGAAAYVPNSFANCSQPFTLCLCQCMARRHASFWSVGAGGACGSAFA